MNNICKYCNKEFSLPRNLIKHQKTARYCLNIQKELNVNQDVILNSLTFHCDYCDKNLTSKENLLNHQRICIQKFIKEKTNDDKRILDLSKKINDLKL